MENRRSAGRFAARALALVVLWGGVSATASAQSYGLGLRAGMGGSISGFDASALDARSLEAQFHVEVEPGVLVRVRAARLHDEQAISHSGVVTHHEADYEKVGVDVEYQHRLSWYRAGLFLGGGYYLFDEADADPSEKDWWVDGDNAFGVYAGVDGWFDLGSGISLVPELSIERVKSAKSRTIGSVSLGLVFTF